MKILLEVKLAGQHLKLPVAFRIKNMNLPMPFYTNAKIMLTI